MRDGNADIKDHIETAKCKQWFTWQLSTPEKDRLQSIRYPAISLKVIFCQGPFLVLAIYKAQLGFNVMMF